MSAVTALVLAGSRAGRRDPLAVAGRIAHKALLPVAGVPMLSRVMTTLKACPEIGTIVVCAQDAAGLVDGLAGAEGVVTCEAEAGPSRSVAAAMERFGTPLLVTTADHPLLTAAMVTYLLGAAQPGIDVTAGVARASVIRAAFPRTSRTWLRFRDGAFSGCNLFLLSTPQASGVLAFWETVERERKRPLSLARLIGVRALLLYALRLATLDGMVRLLGRRTGARLAVVELPFAEAAVDVDKPEDLVLVETILAARLAA